MENNEQVDIIMRQTNYTYDNAKQKLKEYDNNVIEVIRDYMKPDNKPTTDKVVETKKSKNQQIYKEIRSMMDDASARYEKNKQK
jgi:hypothetical protein